MKDLFDRLAASYDTWYERPLGRLVHELELKAILECLDPQPGEAILELGCGTGHYALRLAETGVRVTGVDFSPEMLARARAKATAQGLEITFLESDIHHLPFPEASFDKVLLVTVLEFVADPRAVLAEAYRVLKPGGRLLAGSIGASSAWSKYYREKGATDPKSIFHRARFYDLKELKELLPGNPVRQGTALFFPPDFSLPVAEARQLEQLGRDTGRQDGGFVYVLTEKPAGRETYLSCQLSLYPLATENYGQVIKSSLAVLDKFDLHYTVNAMSTILQGREPEVWAAARALFRAAIKDGRPVVAVMTLSNACGCKPENG